MTKSHISGTIYTVQSDDYDFESIIPPRHCPFPYRCKLILPPQLPTAYTALKSRTSWIRWHLVTRRIATDENFDDCVHLSKVLETTFEWNGTLWEVLHVSRCWRRLSPIRIFGIVRETVGKYSISSHWLYRTFKEQENWKENHANNDTEINYRYSTRIFTRMGVTLKLSSGSLFDCPINGLTVLWIIRPVGCNIEECTLSKEDLMRLFKSKLLSPDWPKGFTNRAIFTVGLLTAMRPTSMALLSSHQWLKMKLGSDFAWKITGTAGYVNGSSRKTSGGWKEIGRNNVEVCLGWLLRGWEDQLF